MFATLPEKTEYIKRPYSLLALTNGKGRVSASARGILGAIWKEQQFKGTCLSTYEELSASINVSRSTTARSLRRLSALGKINKIGTSNYTVAISKEVKSRGYIITPDFFYTSRVVFRDGSERFLSKPEIDVLSLILSYTIKQEDPFDDIESTGKGFVGSVGNIGRLVCLSTTSASNAIESLMKADLIYRNATTDGRNGVAYNRYIANTEIVKLMRKQMRKNKSDVDFTPSELKRLNRETDRQRYYAERERTWTHKIDKKQHALNEIKGYASARIEYKSNAVKLARAEVDGDVENVKAIERRNKELVDIMNRIALSRYTQAEINADGSVNESPPWKCCDIKGYKSDGSPCDCWRKKGKRTK